MKFWRLRKDVSIKAYRAIGPFDDYPEAEKEKQPGDIIVQETYPRNQYGAPIYPFPISGDNADE